MRNWERYQVFRDGRPMKFFAVHVVSDPDKERLSIFEDPAFLRLANDPECPVFRMMGYAALTGNKIPNDPEFLKARLFTETPPNLEKFVDAGLLEQHPDSRTKPYDPVPKKEKENSKEASASLRKRDPVWDALTAELGAAPSTRSERGRWNRAAKELREAGATADDIRSRCAIYRRRWPEVSLTPTALSANWGSLQPPAKAAPPCPECGVGGGLHTAECEGRAA